MFTKEDLILAHSKVKTGVDFPNYIQDCKKLGVIYYETFVQDGRSIFVGKNNYSVTLLPKYERINIASTLQVEQFKKYLLAHQKGTTDFIQFCKDCSETGIEKWKIDLCKMNCTYLDIAGNEVLIEQIPLS